MDRESDDWKPDIEIGKAAAMAHGCCTGYRPPRARIIEFAPRAEEPGQSVPDAGLADEAS